MSREKTTAACKFDLEERLLEYTGRVIDVVERLPTTRAGSHIANQLIRCGTSPLANYSEAQSAESRMDFIHKLKVALKELRETRIWLRLIQRKTIAGAPDRLQPLLGECDELIAIFVASIKTARKNLEQEA
jgi:four helix bundle protein